MINFQNIKALIFDMDGVIVDSEPLHSEACFATCNHFGLAVQENEIKHCLGKTVIDTFRYILKKNGQNQTNLSQLVDFKTKKYIELATNKIESIPDSINFINESRVIFEKLALATSSKKVIQELVIRKFNLENIFNIIVTGDEVSNGKPHPESYLLTSEKLGINPANCAVIEDSINGIIAAKKAGCLVIGIATMLGREALLDAGVDLAINNFAELLEIYKKNGPRFSEAHKHTSG